jgi:hypothetical protein
VVCADDRGSATEMIDVRLDQTRPMKEVLLPSACIRVQKVCR